MKRNLILAVLFLTALPLRADVTINLVAGNLYNMNGTTLAAEGSLLQLIVSRTDTVFDEPTPGSFTGASTDDFVIESFVINAGPGLAAEDFMFSLINNIGAGDHLLLRWFPTLTLADAASGPPPGTPYGQFRTDMIENNSDSGWFVPNDAATVAINFLTTNQGGTRSEVEGTANLVVIPEPSTYALLMVGLAGAAFARRRLKLAA